MYEFAITGYTISDAIPRTMRKLILILAVFTNQVCFGQYLISGYIDSDQKEKTVYLSLLGYDDESLLSSNQILFSTKTDSTGYFEFSGQLLSEKDRLYRVHSNLEEESETMQLISGDKSTNHHNFIFSNRDTIYFPKVKDMWFSGSHSTNPADREWRSLKKYEARLIQEYPQTKNKETKQQAVDDYVRKIKRYTQDSLRYPLVKLMAFADIKRSDFDLSADFKSDPNFYYAIQKKLNEYYHDTSYYLQYQEELSKLSFSVTQQKYDFHKKLSYLLAAFILILLVVIFVLVRKLKAEKAKKIGIELSALTSQEEKISKLICKGKSNKEIASELYISLSTVKTHIRNLYAKLEVTNRQQLAEKLKNQPGD